MGFIKARGGDLYYEEKGSGPSILLIAPSGATASTWGTFADELSGVGRVIAYDRRGYSRSGGEVVRSAAAHTADAAAVVEALDARPAMVVGTSAGATIALDLAVRRPDLVRVVVAHESPWRALLHPDVSGLSTLMRMQWLAWQGRYDDAAEVLLRQVYAYRDGGSAWDDFPEVWRRTARENGRSVVADLRATLGSYPSRARLAKMATPVLCTYGSRSRNYMRAITRSLAQAIPTATLREVDGAGHGVPFDAPGLFAQIIAEEIHAAEQDSGTSRSTSTGPTRMGPTPLPGTAAFREPAYRRGTRQALTVLHAVRAGRARARSDPWRQVAPIDGAALRDLVATVAEEARLVSIPVNRPPWRPTGLTVAAGQQVTWLAWGRLYLVGPLGVGVRPRLVLRGRVGEGPPQDSSCDTVSFRADRSGELRLGSAMPGEMQPDGAITTDRFPYRACSGALTAVVARWAEGTDPAEALGWIAHGDASGLCAAEAGRLAALPTPPAGWDNHPLIGSEQAFFPSDGGMAARGDRTVSIIRHAAEIPLTPSLRLQWTWKLEELPSRLPEDTTLTHDYLSVALEFDDGRDLTWYWSAGLPVGASYPCPLPHWRRRETHVVVRTGTTDLGRWVDEDRPVLADHRAAIGGPVPGRVVRAWLISCTFPQAGHTAGEFKRIQLVDGTRTLRVLGDRRAETGPARQAKE